MNEDLMSLNIDLDGSVVIKQEELKVLIQQIVRETIKAFLDTEIKNNPLIYSDFKFNPKVSYPQIPCST